MTWDLPRTQTSLFRPKCVRKGRREGDNGRDGALPAVCTLPMVPCGSSPAARLYLAKNEAPEEETDLGLCCNQMWDARWQRFEPRTQNTVMCVKLSTQASVDLVLVELKQLRRQRQKTIGFMSKTTALHVHQALKYISLTSTARLRRETSQRNVL